MRVCTALLVWLALAAMPAAAQPAKPQPAKPQPATPQPARTQPARPRPPRDRIWISVGGGMQTAGSDLSDAFDLTLYTEPEHLSIHYPSRAAGSIAASGGYRWRKHVFFGAGMTYATRSGSANVAASLPHPFFDNRYRDVSGDAGASRGETAGHLLLGWMTPLTPKVRLLLTAGPSVVHVSQTLVTNVTFSEVYPYDTATFTGAAAKLASGTGAGVNAGADVSWMLSPRAGVGVLAQFTRASVRVKGGDRSASIDAGGVTVAAGIRLLF